MKTMSVIELIKILRKKLSETRQVKSNEVEIINIHIRIGDPYQVGSPYWCDVTVFYECSNKESNYSVGFEYIDNCLNTEDIVLRTILEFKCLFPMNKPTLLTT